MPLAPQSGLAPQPSLMLWCLGVLSLAAPCRGEPLPAAVGDFLRDHCLDCHAGADAAGRLDLQAAEWNPADAAGHRRWVRVLDRVAGGEMPPAEAAQPEAADRRRFLELLRKELLQTMQARRRREGRTAVRRLNRVEYERTVQELLAVSTPLRDLLPEDQALHGFDKVAEGLRFSPLHIAKYLEAADRAIEDAWRLEEAPQVIRRRFEYRDQKGVRQNIDASEGKPICRDLDQGVAIFADASYITKVHDLHLRESGWYRIRARGWAIQSQRPVILRLHAGNYRAGGARVLGYFDMLPDEPREVEVVALLQSNEYLYPAPDDLYADQQGKNIWNIGARDFTGSGLALEWIEVEGPLYDQWPPESTRRLLGQTPWRELEQPQWREGRRIAWEPAPADPAADVRAAVADFAARAFRRPATVADAEPFAQLAADALRDGESFADALQLGCRAILASPQFLLLRETPGPLDDHALASRLSYFLWSAPPDSTLLQLAARGELTADQELRRQTERLLDDPRSHAFIESFLGQWLDLRRIDATSPDQRLYPEFDELLKLSMIGETEAFFRELLDQNLPCAMLIDSEFAMLNRRLAEHYEIPGVSGQSFRRVALPPDSPRGGVLTQASVLKVTANGTVTSPVLRGAWVLTRLLNQPPPPPPPNVGSIEPDTRGATTIREQLQRHRGEPTCAACHAAIDPPGFALESFDVIGGHRQAYRSQDQGTPPETLLRGRRIHEYRLGQPVDASGQLPDGREFENIREFKTLLMEQRELVAESLLRNLIAYASGTPVELADREELQDMLGRLRRTDFGVRDMLHEVVQSSMFRQK